MQMHRREFLKAGVSAGLLTTVGASCAAPKTSGNVSLTQLDRVLNNPVLEKKYFKNPVKIRSMELFRNKKTYFVKVTSEDGAEGYAVSHPSKMAIMFPILLKQVFPSFIGKDARNLEQILEEVYLYKSNYKMQGQPFWIPVASAEFAVLDLLGRIAGKPVGDLFGGVKRHDIAVYRANNHRGKTAEESVELIKKSVEKSGAKAVKYKIGGRMRKNKDFPPHRSEKLIPLVRKALGDEIVIYADSNGSYDAREAIRIGKMLEETRVSFYEEPCPFDHYRETKEVADALEIPIAGGECENSIYRFRWMIHSNTLQVVQPDLFYFGGFVRSVRVAKMAEAAGIPCTPHISGGGLGYVYMLHFASCVPDPGPYQEFKGSTTVPLICETSSLQSENGLVRVPSGPGWGVDLDPDFVKNAELARV